MQTHENNRLRDKATEPAVFYCGITTILADKDQTDNSLLLIGE